MCAIVEEEAMSWIELFGYLGSFLVLVSFLMTSVFKLRVVNTVGSVIFAVYALIIRSYPTALMNICLVGINLRFLWKMMHTRRDFEIVRVKPDDLYLQHFLEVHAPDIQACFPGISLDLSAADDIRFIQCEQRPAAVFAARTENGTMEILLDYSVPEFRDFSVGVFLQEQLPGEGIHTLVYRGPVEHHKEYLAKMGYEKDGDRYVCRLQRS
ncbi:MAG: YgjV family protein [Solobacterium sp.]|nr:YgjV family protein [Solobacterium sp.]MBQ1446480.1 YgjV family protein [Solobacterium sp.]